VSLVIINASLVNLKNLIVLLVKDLEEIKISQTVLVKLDFMMLEPQTVFLVKLNAKNVKLQPQIVFLVTIQSTEY
jgi:hypothetical protein